MNLPFFRRKQRLAESAEELQFYVESETEDNIARGMPPEEARAAAKRKLGNPALIREEVYRMYGIAFLENTWSDVRYSLRTLRKSPVFTLAAVLTLAIGIGGNAAMFTVIRAVLLKPLEYRDPGRLVRPWLERANHISDGSFSLLRLEELRTAKSFTGIGAYLKFKEDVALSGQGTPEALQGARVTANFLDVLGVQPLAGRSFRPEEETSGGPAVAMISARLWKRRFGSDPQILGKAITLNSTAYTIIGVLPEGFAFPFNDTDVWLTKPSEWSLVPQRAWPYVSSLQGFARLKPGTTLRQAQAEMDVLHGRYKLAHPEQSAAEPGATTVLLSPLKDRLVSNVSSTLWTLFGAVGFVLLIACANIAGLLLARASGRSREFAVRAALGAPRSRLVRQLLVESLVLAVLGGTLGVLLAKWMAGLIKHVSVLNLPRAGEIQLDGTVLAFTLGSRL